MEQWLREWALAVRERMYSSGVIITGVQWYVPQQGQHKKKALYACLQGTTANAFFFGEEYTNRRRTHLMDLAYESAFSLPGKPPADELALDIRLSLSSDAFAGEPLIIPQRTTAENPDVTREHDVKLVRLADAMASGDVEEGTMFPTYCRRYSLDHILMHGGHHISPDSASVDLLEDILQITAVGSVLEFGAGVGTCGAAAHRRGVRDYTFVDISPVVCRHVSWLFPQYRVIQADALAWRMDRHWDVVLVSTPYELDPWFLERQGETLAKSCRIAVFQSGCRAFFDWEHDWLMGRLDRRWPWLRTAQTLSGHFPYVEEYSVDWQLAAVGCQEEVLAKTLSGCRASGATVRSLYRSLTL